MLSAAANPPGAAEDSPGPATKSFVSSIFNIGINEVALCAECGDDRQSCHYGTWTETVYACDLIESIGPEGEGARARSRLRPVARSLLRTRVCC